MVPLSTPLIKYYPNQAAKNSMQLFFLIPRKSHPSKEPPIKISLKGKGQENIYYENRCHLGGRGNNAKKNLPMCQ